MTPAGASSLWLPVPQDPTSTSRRIFASNHRTTSVDPADPAAALHRVRWDKRTEDEVGEDQFIGRLFNEHGQIYQGCTASDAATYTIKRLAALGGNTCPAQQAPGSVTTSVVIESAGRSNYASENFNRVAVTPINSLYPLSYEPGSRYGATPKYWLIVGVPPQARQIGSIIHTRHINGSATATIDWEVVDPRSTSRNIPAGSFAAAERVAEALSRAERHRREPDLAFLAEGAAAGLGCRSGLACHPVKPPQCTAQAEPVSGCRCRSNLLAGGSRRSRDTRRLDRYSSPGRRAGR